MMKSKYCGKRLHLLKETKCHAFNMEYKSRYSLQINAENETNQALWKNLTNILQCYLVNFRWKEKLKIELFFKSIFTLQI